MKKKAFTLIELLIVITIIGILAVAILPRLSSGPAKARDVRRISDIDNIANSLTLYYADNGFYPYDGSTLPDSECLDSSSSAVADLLEYTQDVPEDPGDLLVGSCKGYYYIVMPGINGGDDASAFALFANIELEEVEAPGYYCISTGGPSTTGYASYEDSVTLLNLAASTPPCTGARNVHYVILR